MVPVRKETDTQLEELQINLVPLDDRNIRVRDGFVLVGEDLQSLVPVYNAGNSDESNRYAFDYAKRTGVQTIAGSDTHQTSSFGQGGLIFTRRLYTPENLIEDLFARRYRLITGQDQP